MMKSIPGVVLVFLVTIADAQVKIGHDAANINSVTMLELGNNTADASSTWKSFIPPTGRFYQCCFYQ